MRSRTTSVVAWSFWVASIGSLFAGLAIGHGSAHVVQDPGGTAPLVTTLVFVLAYATVGALVASKRPENPIGWILLASACGFVIGTWGAELEGVNGASRFSDWIGWIWGLSIGLTATFGLLLFPTGKLPTRRWRPVAWVAALALAAWVLGNAFAPGRIPDTRSVNPFGIGGPAGDLAKVFRDSFGLVIAAALASIVSLFFRFRRADAVEREQLKWLSYAAAVILASIVTSGVLEKVLGTTTFENNIENAVTAGALTLVPIAIGVAVMKYRLYDIDLVINKTLVFGALAAFITAVYVAIVVGIGHAVGQGSNPNVGLSILATAVVAVAFQPVRSKVQRFANRLVYGKRATPYEVLSEFSSRMAGTYANEDLLPRMARILAEGTGASASRVWLRVGDELRCEAAWPEGAAAGVDPLPVADDGGGDPVFAGATASYPVHHTGDLLGALTLTKPRGERLSPAEDKLATDLASQAGLVLRNVRLTEELLQRLDELQASRQRIVAAQDQERRRLERNIHDGAQQQLVALAVKLRLARGFMQKDHERFDVLMAQLEEESRGALEDLRDLARGIYPPLLADQGLVAALTSQARKAAFPVHIAGDGIGRYPQEAEAAVYFCVLEALQNVAKYAQASAARVELSEIAGVLAFTVTDDGVGFDPDEKGYGTGMQGMADRLAALGGSLAVSSRPGEGTTVSGRVPVVVGGAFDQVARLETVVAGASEG